MYKSFLTSHPSTEMSRAVKKVFHKTPAFPTVSAFVRKLYKKPFLVQLSEVGVLSEGFVAHRSSPRSKNTCNIKRESERAFAQKLGLDSGKITVSGRHPRSCRGNVAPVFGRNCKATTIKEC